MSLFQLLNGNNYGVFNRNIAHEIGLNETLLLSEILDKYSYFKNEGQLVAAPGQDGEWFYLKAETIFQRTTLTERQQRPCIEKLVNLGFIKKISFGLPCLRHFQVCEEVIEEFIVSKIKTTRGYKKEGLSPDKSSGPDLTKCKDSPIYKRPSEETKEETNGERGDAGAPPPPTPTEPIFKFGYIEMKQSEKEVLENQYGAALIEDYIERVNDWFANNLKEHKTKRNDAGRIRNWLKRDGHKKIEPKKEKQPSFSSKENPQYASMAAPSTRRYHANYYWTIEKMEQSKALQFREKIVIHTNRIDFSSLPEGEIYYDSEGYKDRFDSNMRKLQK